MHRRVIAALGMLSLLAGACASSEHVRPTAKAGQIVTVLRGAPGHPRERVSWSGLAVGTDGTLYATALSPDLVVKIPRRGSPKTLVDGTTSFPPPPHLGDIGSADAVLHPRLLHGIAVDRAGNVYFSGQSSEEVYGLTASGAPRWVAGNGGSGQFAPVNGPATSALTQPTALAFDSAGDLYILNGHSVAKLDRNGMLSTVTAADDLVAMALGAAGDIYLGSGRRVVRVNTQGATETIAADVGDRIKSLAVDGKGDVFVAGGNQVREITTDGVVHTVAQFNDPYALAVDGAGNLYIAENDRIRMVGRPTAH